MHARSMHLQLFAGGRRRMLVGFGIANTCLVLSGSCFVAAWIVVLAEGPIGLRWTGPRG